MIVSALAWAVAVICYTCILKGYMWKGGWGEKGLLKIKLPMKVNFRESHVHHIRRQPLFPHITTSEDSHMFPTSEDSHIFFTSADSHMFSASTDSHMFFTSADSHMLLTSEDSHMFLTSADSH